MNAGARGSALGFATLFLCGCSLIPDLPGDFALPVDEIFLHSACELQRAFYSLQAKEFARFDARNWLIKIALLPKVDTDINPGLGLTRRVPTTSGVPRFTTWGISSPGANADASAERNSGVNFNFNSGDLIDDKALPCDDTTPSYHALAQHLGVGEWLRRTVAAVSQSSSGKVDAPTYNSDITIKFSANGSYTYTFPHGTDLATLAGFYKLDEQLQISMTATPKPKTFQVVTLPIGDNFTPNSGSGRVLSTATEQSAQQRLDIIGVQEAIRSLESKLSP